MSKARTKKLCLAAFKPFAGDSVNPALEVARPLAKQLGLPLLELPVLWRVSAASVLKWIGAENPTDLVVLGQATGRPEVNLERVALNFQEDRPDEAGNRVEEGLITRRSLLTALFTTYPIGEWKDEWARDSLPVVVSNSAGSFICNEVYFRVMDKFPRILLVHLPLLPEQKARGVGNVAMDLPQQIQIVEKILRKVIEYPF